MKSEHARLRGRDWVRLDFNFRCSCWWPHNKMITGFCKLHAWSLYTQPTLVGNLVFNKTSYLKLFYPMVNGFVLTTFLLVIWNWTDDARQNEVYLLSFRSFFTSCNITTETNLSDWKKHVEHFSSEGKYQNSFQDTARFAGTEEDALHPAVLLSTTSRSKMAPFHCLNNCRHHRRRHHHCRQYQLNLQSAKDTYISTLHEVTMKIDKWGGNDRSQNIPDEDNHALVVKKTPVKDTHIETLYEMTIMIAEN